MRANPRHELFAREYAVRLNAKEAAIAAGYSPKSAKYQGNRLLSDPRVKAIFEMVFAPRLESMNVSVERIRLERARMAFYDAAEMFDANDDVLPIRKMNANVRRGVKGIEVVKDKDGRVITKLQFVDRNPSLVALERMEGLYADEGADKKAGFLNISINLGETLDGRIQPPPNAAPARYVGEELPESATHSTQPLAGWPICSPEEHEVKHSNQKGQP